MLVAVCTALLFLFAADLNARSQKPSPRTMEISQPQQQEPSRSDPPSTTDQHGTEQFPFVVKIIPPPKTEREAAPDAADRNTKTTNGWGVLDINTAILAAIGALQLGVFLWQGIQLKRSVDIGNREFIATHRPRLVVRFTQSDAIKPNEKAGVQLIVDNAGASDAHVMAMAGDIGQKRGADWIPPWVWPNGVPEERLLKAGERSIFKVTATWPLSVGDIAEIESGRNKLMLVGAFKYRDGNNVVRYTGFYREFNWEEREFRKIIPTPDKEYEG
jgi:hypothetical protein